MIPAGSPTLRAAPWGRRAGRLIAPAWLVAAFVGLGVSGCLHAPGPPQQALVRSNDAPDPLRAEMERNLATARWMMDYDRVAWSTTDLLAKESQETLQRVGPIWFCLQHDGAWFAVYGSETERGYEIAVCYREVAPGKFAKTPAPELSDTARFVRAVRLTRPAIDETTRRTTVRFNYYVRAEPERIAVYYLPALQTDGKLAYGIQHTFYVDAAAETILTHDQVGDTLIGLLPDKSRVVTLEMPQYRTPTPQALFTMMSYRDRFEDIVTHCRDGYYKVRAPAGVWTCVPAYATAGGPDE